MTVYVCFDKDIECGDRPENWCLGCPKRGFLQVAVAPHAAAGPWPTAMRPATAEEAAELQRRFSGMPPGGDLTDERFCELWERARDGRPEGMCGHVQVRQFGKLLYAELGIRTRGPWPLDWPRGVRVPDGGQQK